LERALDERATREIAGDLDDNIKYQVGNALKEGRGSISDIIGMQVGFSFAKDVVENIDSSTSKSNKSKRDMPPPLPDREVNYYVAIDGESKGPFSSKEVDKMVADGDIKRDTLMWKKGLDSWVEARELIGESFREVPLLFHKGDVLKFKVINFKCRGCGGSLRFNPFSNSLKCDFCGGIEKIELKGGLVKLIL